MNEQTNNTPNQSWRQILFEVIFEANTPAGKWFDIVLIACILLSVTTVMLDSVAGVRAEHSSLLYAAEWFFTILFTIEYILRLLCIGRPARYAYAPERLLLVRSSFRSDAAAASAQPPG